MNFPNTDVDNQEKLCRGLTWQPATKHQTAAHSPLRFTPAGWGGEWTKGETRRLR